MEEINNFQQEPDETLYQAWERFKELLMKCPQHYLTEMQETAEDAKKAIQEMAEYSQKWHNGTSRGRSTETSDGLAAIQAQLNNLGREIKKVNEKVYAAQVGCEQCKGPHYTKDCPLKEEGKTLEEAYYTQFGGPFQGGGYRATRGTIKGTTQSFVPRTEASMEDTMSKFMSESAKRHEENSNLIKEIRAMTDAAIRNQGASIKTLEIQIGQMSKLIHTRYAILDLLNMSYPLDRTGNHGPKFTEAYGASHINNTIPRKEKDPGSFTLPCFINDVCFDNALVDLGASVNVMPLSTYLNLGLGELAHTRLTVELADRTVKYPKGIAESDKSRRLFDATIEGSEVVKEFRTGKAYIQPLRMTWQYMFLLNLTSAGLNLSPRNCIPPEVFLRSVLLDIWHNNILLALCLGRIQMLDADSDPNFTTLDYVLAKGFVNEFPDLKSVKLMKFFLHCLYPCRIRHCFLNVFRFRSTHGECEQHIADSGCKLSVLFALAWMDFTN
ncbi:hypothetical protein Tco_1502544 [Tanacetum coccineum]